MDLVDDEEPPDDTEDWDQKTLVRNIGRIRNKIFRSAVSYMNDQEETLTAYLRSVKPVLPRFLSEFKAATFLVLTESLLNLFQNSRYIRSHFSYLFAEKIAFLLRLSEELSFNILLGNETEMPGRIMWECSSTRADNLRLRSWGEKLVGTTVPHPLDYLQDVTNGTSCCDRCDNTSRHPDYVTVCNPGGFHRSDNHRGPLPAYLGSKTTESTALFHPWEKESIVPVIGRAAKLRAGINWFIEPESNVSKSILNNLTSLTGENWGEDLVQYARTGSALHRFHCSKQSNGGFAAISPNPLTYLLVTADTMSVCNRENYDFMYQSSLLYAETVSVERNSRARG